MKGRRVLGAAVLAGAMAAGIAVPASAAASSPDRAACAAVYHLHHVQAVPVLYAQPAVFDGAFRVALAAARDASPAVSGPAVFWLYEDTHWSQVRAVCAGYVR